MANKENDFYEDNFEPESKTDNETPKYKRGRRVKKTKPVMDDLDQDGDGKVSIEEMNMKVTIEKAWGRFDEDGNGTIEEHELEDILEQIDESFLDENKLEDVLKELDSGEADGKIDKEEFTNWILGRALGTYLHSRLHIRAFLYTNCFCLNCYILYYNVLLNATTNLPQVMRMVKKVNYLNV